jgi:DNA-damage-inducible protein D
MTDDLTPCENTNNELTFEDFKNENGSTFWWASDLMMMLGYKEMKSFHKVIDRATKAFVALNIPHYENIIPYNREKDGKSYQDFKLSRFACYLVAMNGDPKKPEVATAQTYFATQTRKFELYLENSNQFERLLIRDELTDGNKSLMGAAKAAGVVNYAYFQDAGCRGLYNMSGWQLKEKRGLDQKDNIADYMGRTELAANLFKVTQTEEVIKNKKVQGQSELEKTHFEVGREVRNMVQRNVGKSPEELGKEKYLPQVKKELKDGYKKMLKEDSRKNKKD